MKSYILLTILAALTTSSFAASNFKILKSKTCDGVNFPVSARERVSFDAKAGMLAFASDDETGCGVADFYMVLTTARSSDTTIVEPISAAGRKNCRNEMSQPQPIFFKSAIIKANSIVLTNVDKCKKVELKF